MRTFTAVIERDAETGLFVGQVPGIAGAHSQGETLDELRQNLVEVLELLFEGEGPVIEGQFVGTQLITIGGGDGSDTRPEAA